MENRKGMGAVLKRLEGATKGSIPIFEVSYVSSSPLIIGLSIPCLFRFLSVLFY